MIEIIVLLLLCFVQSIFGVGLLIIGTPIFLIITENFFVTLSILLPLSVSISFLQILRKTKDLDVKFINNFNFICIPTLILFLFFISSFEDLLNLKIIISSIIILFSCYSLFSNTAYFKKNKIYKLFLLMPNKLIIFILSLIHGLTNAGGTVLTLYCSNFFENKKKIRLHIAYGYLIMGSVQLIYMITFDKFYFDNKSFILVFFVPLIFVYSKKLYEKLNDISFSIILNFLALMSGLYLFFVSVFFI